MKGKTDLAMEARELWQQEAGETTRLPGVRAREHRGRGICSTVVEILDAEGEAALEKPRGTYVTLELAPGLLQTPSGFARASLRLARELEKLLPARGQVLVAGLGNQAVTPDSVGPRSLHHLVVTRHLGKSYPQLRPVSAMAPGVLGTTGLESVEVLQGIVERSKPCCVVAVDALASCCLDRLFTTVQLADTGIIPGSGVGNHRAALNRKTLGVPVIAVGIPTVVEAFPLISEKFQSKQPETAKSREQAARNLIVTPRDADAKAELAARLLGYGISMGLHRTLSPEDISCLTGG